MTSATASRRVLDDSPARLDWRRSLIAAAISIGVYGCSDPSSVNQLDDVSHFLTADEQHRAFVMVNAESGRIVRRIELGGRIESATLASDSSKLYVGTVDDANRRWLISIALRGPDLEWKRPLPATGSGQGDTAVLSTASLASTPESARLFAWYSEANGVPGIARFDVNTFAIDAFYGPVSEAVYGIVPLDDTPDGLLAVIARSNHLTDNSRHVLLLRANSVSAADSIPAAEFGTGDVPLLRQILPSSSPSAFYVFTDRSIVLYDLSQHRVIARTDHPVRGKATITPSGKIVVTDGGIWPDAPGSGLLHVFTSSLQHEGTVDVSSPLGGHPHSAIGIRTTDVTAAPGNPEHVYVRAGSDRYGPLYPPQRARILVVGLQSMALLRTIELPGYGGSFISAVTLKN